MTSTHMKHLNYMLDAVKKRVIDIEKILFVGPSNNFLHNKENSLEKKCMDSMETIFVTNNKSHKKLFSKKGLNVMLEDVCELDCNNSFVLIENPAGTDLKKSYPTTSSKIFEIAKNLSHKNKSFYLGLIGVPYEGQEGQITEKLIMDLYKELEYYMPTRLNSPGKENEISLLFIHF